MQYCFDENDVVEPRPRVQEPNSCFAAASSDHKTPQVDFVQDFIHLAADPNEKAHEYCRRHTLSFSEKTKATPDNAVDTGRISDVSFKP